MRSVEQIQTRLEILQKMLDLKPSQLDWQGIENINDFRRDLTIEVTTLNWVLEKNNALLPS